MSNAAIMDTDDRLINIDVLGALRRRKWIGVAVGVLIGLAGAFAAGPALSPFLFGVSATDPVAYGAIFLLLASVSIAASWIPARRAGRVQPAAVLRGD